MKTVSSEWKAAQERKRLLIQFYPPVFISVCSSFGVRWTAIPPCNWPRWSGFCFHSVYLGWHLFVQQTKKSRAKEDLFLGIEHAAKFQMALLDFYLDRRENIIRDIERKIDYKKKKYGEWEREREKKPNKRCFTSCWNTSFKTTVP